MKKSLVALAVLAASGAAFAQSTVTVYGKADAFFGSFKKGQTRQTKLDSGVAGTSRWGLKGSEDLGGGLKANFVFEQGFNIDDGSAKDATKAFDRLAYVGFSGDFGEVRLGNVKTAFDGVSGASNSIFGSDLSPMGNVFRSDDYTGNPGNTLYYASPNFSGFSGAVSYSLGEDKSESKNASSIASLGLSYKTGPVAVQFGYQTEKPKAISTDTVSRKFTRLGGSYDFGVVVAKLTYGRSANYDKQTKTTVDGLKATEYQIGADFPVSEALTLSANYARSKDSDKTVAGVTTAGDKRTGYGFGAKYSLSKRTFVYGGLESDTTKKADDTSIKNRILGVGVNHVF